MPPINGEDRIAGHKVDRRAALIILPTIAIASVMLLALIAVVLAT